MKIADFLPKPDLEACKKLLCVQPHPDDMDISAGGTIARLADNGTEVYYLTITDDTAGFMEIGAGNTQRRKDQRKEEQYAAGRILGVKDYFWMDYPDAGDWSMHQARNDIIKYIRKIRPDFVMTIDPWLPYEAHQDHIKGGMAACEALVLFNFPFIKTDEAVDKDFEPYDIDGVAFSFTSKSNTVVDVGNNRERKFSAIAAHKSQFSEEMLEMLKLYDEFRSKELAEKCDFEFGEGFKVLNPTYMLHSFPEAIDY
ncbi:MAG: PIG-L family deacetylase [Proteobacteria bacterium]|nr:PIG-L family deacetylase [Pseudomonadota bacterium]